MLKQVQHDNNRHANVATFVATFASHTCYFFAPVGISRRCARLSYVALERLRFRAAQRSSQTSHTCYFFAPVGISRRCARLSYVALERLRKVATFVATFASHTCYFFSSITACAAASPCELCLQSANAQIASALLLFFDNRLCRSEARLRNSKRRARHIIQANSVAEFY